MLAVYPLVLKALRGLPPDEYAQALRAPAWFTVVIGGALSLLALWALRVMASSPGGAQVLVGLPGQGALLMADAYTLWSCAILGAALAVGAWVPAARRSLIRPSLLPFPIILLLTWLAQLMLCSLRVPVALVCWLLILMGVGVVWYLLFRPRRQWQALEMPLVLLLAALLSTIGLLWLHRLSHGETLADAWVMLLSANPQATNGAALLLVLGWLGPAIYLPWWLWTRRDEASMLWLPAALVTVIAAQFALVHILYLAFPPASDEIVKAAGIHPLFLIERTLGWMTAWGLLALLAGSGWLAYVAVMRLQPTVARLRPLALVAAGVLLIGISMGLQGQQQGGMHGLLWLQLAWASMLCVWLAAGGMLTALAPTEQAERTTVQIACWLSLLTLIAMPPGPGYRGLAALWEPMQTHSVPRALIVLTLVVAGMCAGAALPRWFAQQTVPTPRPGAAWGILGPFLLAFVILLLGFFSLRLTPLLDMIGRSLLHTF